MACYDTTIMKTSLKSIARAQKSFLLSLQDEKRPGFWINNYADTSSVKCFVKICLLCRIAVEDKFVK